MDELGGCWLGLGYGWGLELLEMFSVKLAWEVCVAGIGMGRLKNGLIDWALEIAG